MCVMREMGSLVLLQEIDGYMLQLISTFANTSVANCQDGQ